MNTKVTREIKFRLYFYEGKRLTYSTHAFEVTSKRLHIMLAMFEENTIVGFAQFTGHHDKSGQEIYEGDLIKFYDKTVAEIVFEPFGGWSFKWTDETYKRVRRQNPEPIFRNINLFEVVGTIYEHPNLLSQ